MHYTQRFMPDRGKMCGMICERQSDKFAFLVSDVMGTAPNLAWPWLPSCIVSEAPELDTLTHLSTWWLWVAKCGKQKEFQIHMEADRKPSQRMRFGKLTLLGLYNVILFFFFFIQPCLRPWNSDCS